MIASLDGDKAAYRALLLALMPIVQAYLARRVRTGREDVADLVQDTMMAIHARRITYDRTRALMPWVFAIAHHKFIDWVRRRRPTSSLDESGYDPGIDSFETSRTQQLTPTVCWRRCHPNRQRRSGRQSLTNSMLPKRR